MLIVTTHQNCPFFKSFWPLITIVPVVIWAEACPIASSSTKSLNTAGLKLFVVYIHQKNRVGDEQRVIGGRWCYGAMPPVHVQGPVCPDHVAASAWLPMSWLCSWLSICLVVSGREDLSLHSVGSILNSG